MDKLMSQKEAKKAQVLELLKEHKISRQEASKRLGITTRQVRRLTKRYQTAGLAGLVSQKRGRASNRRLNETLRAQAIDLIGMHYRDFGPTLACEKLSEIHDVQLSVESTRQIMIKAGYWRPRKGGTVCAHPMRERRARFGELIQIDGSPHDWFEGRGDYCTLLVFIDDATGRLTQLRFAPTETTLGYPDTHAALQRTLSVQVTKTLSKNLSCQHENQLLQVATTGKGLGLRGAQITIHQHFDGSRELLWKKRKLTYGVMDKPQRQSPVADGKSVNAQVDKAVARRSTEHRPAPNHPWRKKFVGKSVPDGQRAAP